MTTMNSLPTDLKNIVMDYKYGMEVNENKIILHTQLLKNVENRNNRKVFYQYNLNNQNAPRENWFNENPLSADYISNTSYYYFSVYSRKSDTHITHNEHFGKCEINRIENYITKLKKYSLK